MLKVPSLDDSGANKNRTETLSDREYSAFSSGDVLTGENTEILNKHGSINQRPKFSVWRT